MSSPPVFLPLPVADSVQEPYPPLYGVRISRMGGSTHTELINKVESKAFRLIDSPPHTDCLQPLTLRHNVASLAIFYLCSNANCFSELANCMPPISRALAAHDVPLALIHIVQPRVNQYLHSFFSSTGKLYKSLLESVFPPCYDLNSFKRGVSRHLQP